MTIFVNGRFRSHNITGHQRYAHELTNRMDLAILEPPKRLRGWRGHLWEQTSLRVRARGGILWSPCGAGPLGLRSHVVTFHDIFPLDFPAGYSRPYSAWYQIMMPRLANAACHLIAVSNYTKDRLVCRFGINPDRITVIHNGVDGKFFGNKASFRPVAASQTLRLPSANYLLCVGSVEPRKNLKRLVAAWKSVCCELPANTWLVITGSTSRIYRQLDLGAELPRVHFTGYVDDADLIDLYAGAQGFVYPSLAEGFGLPPLEAMACGIPVLTSSVTSLPEVCGSAALYVDPTSTADLAAKIKVLLTEEPIRRHLSVHGPSWAKRYTWELAASQTYNVLQKVASGETILANETSGYASRTSVS